LIFFEIFFFTVYLAGIPLFGYNKRRFGYTRFPAIAHFCVIKILAK